MNELIRKDEAARERIVNDIGSSFFVEAGAGSGKTTVLVRRMAAMVAAGIDVSRICAITFTKAAAGEFYSRFQDILMERSMAETRADFKCRPGELGNPTDETRARCREALNNIDLCFMGTIDSFCNMILSEHPAEAGVPSNARILSDDGMDALYRREYSRIQNGRYGNELKELNRTFRGLYKRPSDVFFNTLKVLMERRNAHFIYPEIPSGTIDEFCKEEKNALKSLVTQLLAHPESAYDGNGDSRNAWAALREKGSLLAGSWDGRLWEVLDAVKGLKGLRLVPQFEPDRLGPQGRIYFQEHSSRGKLKWYEMAEDEILKPQQKLKDFCYSITMNFVCRCIPVIAEQLKKEGALSFFDYMLYLRDMLHEDARAGGKLIRHIYARHSYYLIDEFQDTNPMQAEIFFYLTAMQPEENWRKCIPHPGSIFIVGDPKQSIYRFRNADVSSYLKVKELFQGDVGEVLYLSRNFRSTDHMNRWFNRVFAELLPANTADQSRFEEIPLEDAPEPDGTFGGIYTYSCRKDKNAPADMADPYMAAQVIRCLVNNPGHLIRERRDKTPREIRYSDFMLITPAKGKLHEYTAQFNTSGIPFRIEGKIIFRESPALTALTYLYLAVALPNESRYLYGALTGSVYRVPEQELLRLKNEGLSLSIFAANDRIDESEKVIRILQELKDLYYYSEKLSPSALFSLLLERYDIYRIAGAENMEYVYYALELLRAAESSGEAISVEEGGRFLENLLNDDSAAERCVSLTRGQDRVHIANLHKVKGLEASVVILAGRDRKAPKADIRVEQAEEGTQGWLFQASKYAVQTSLYKDRQDAELASLWAERDRLLYVAATRAKSALIVGDVQKASGERTALNPWTFFAERSDGEFFETIDRNDLHAPVPDKVSASELYKGNRTVDLSDPALAKATFEVLRPSQVKVKALTDSEDEFDDTSEAETVRSNRKKHDPALIGTIVHRLMEMLVSSRNTVVLEDAIQEIAQDYEAGDSYYKDILEQAGTTVRSGGFPQAAGVPQDILQELLSAEEVHCELPFCYREPRAGLPAEDASAAAASAASVAANADDIRKEVIWHGIMDVIYKKDGRWHIIDYKTNADPDDLDEKYQAQLAAYKAAFKAMTGEEADARVYHIKI